jgi:sugar lactone lactonase YvrE
VHSKDSPLSRLSTHRPTRRVQFCESASIRYGACVNIGRGECREHARQARVLIGGGNCPLHHAAEHCRVLAFQRLYWVDSVGSNLFRCTTNGDEIRAWDLPAKVGSFALRNDGNGAVVALANGFHSLDFKTGECTLIHNPEADKPNNRLNDGKVGRHGRFIVGSMDTMEEGANGALYSLDPDFSVKTIDRGVVCSNGPCWSPDDRIFYFADTWSGEIWAYDYPPCISTSIETRRRRSASV